VLTAITQASTGNGEQVPVPFNGILDMARTAMRTASMLRLGDVLPGGLGEAATLGPGNFDGDGEELCSS
jgi:hypothetical protein